VVVTTVELPGITLVSRGKVRDIFRVGGDLLIVATDRISAFDVVLPDGIPDKGAVLTGLSAFWFERFTGVIANHLVTTDPGQFPEELAGYRRTLEGRAMLVRRAEPLPVECIVRGYIAGSAWREYRADGKVSGQKLPAGLRQAEMLPEPLFTPSTKAASGHDENISYDRMTNIVGDAAARVVRDAALRIYSEAAQYARERGIIIADTKFEFGFSDGAIMLIDEALTPDSSRFWDLAEYDVGISPPSFDKQFVRDYLETLDWNKTPPGPALPAEVIAGTARRYREAFRRLTGFELPASG